MVISSSTKREHYEILIRERSDTDFAAYCPQLYRMVKSTSFSEVYSLMDTVIAEHIRKLGGDEPVPADASIEQEEQDNLHKDVTSVDDIQQEIVADTENVYEKIFINDDENIEPNDIAADATVPANSLADTAAEEQIPPPKMKRIKLFE